MDLKERIKESMQLSTDVGDLKKFEQSESHNVYAKFLDIEERVSKTVDMSDVYCEDYNSVFELVEKHNIDVTDIIAPYEYNDFKQLMLNDTVMISPSIGKKPDKVYDFAMNKID